LERSRGRPLTLEKIIFNRLRPLRGPARATADVILRIAGAGRMSPIAWWGVGEFSGGHVQKTNGRDCC
jgi:hypothetical protein